MKLFLLLAVLGLAFSVGSAAVCDNCGAGTCCGYCDCDGCGADCCPYQRGVCCGIRGHAWCVPQGRPCTGGQFDMVSNRFLYTILKTDKIKLEDALKRGINIR